MMCAIIYKDGKFRFKYGEVKFEVSANGKTEGLFDFLGSLLVAEHIKNLCGVDNDLLSLMNGIKRDFWRRYGGDLQ